MGEWISRSIVGDKGEKGSRRYDQTFVSLYVTYKPLVFSISGRFRQSRK